MPPSAACPKARRQCTDRRLLTALKAILKPLGTTGKLHTFQHYFIKDALLSKTLEAMVRTWVGHVNAKVMDLYPVCR